MAVVLSMLLSIGACCGIFGLGPALVQARSGVVFVVGILVFILAGIFQALASAVLVHAFRMAARSPAGYLHPAFAVPGLLFVSFLFIVGICIVLWGVGCALSAGPKPSDLCP